ncbi:olfactory receptor 5B12-like [Spea bombifrons]|uniref:olfactory receptor 5B12-like n=1 Tax=Spea bombifrons TaxID=233779 RepID=UPI00234A1B60|nr:olfactory receptor 5B12-like [Spea bombifrons]
MFGENETLVTVFYFEGLTDNRRLEIALFVIFLVVYTFTVLGNGGLIFLIVNEPVLHTPMYFFLKHLSFVDICYSSVIIPRTMSDFLSAEKAISFVACAFQMYFFAAFANVECLLLAIMAYDRYAAICKPLLYYIIMRREVCISLTAMCYACGFFDSMIHAGNTFTQIYCKSNRISHYLCEPPPVLKLSCSDTSHTELVIFAIVGINFSASVILVVISYMCIFFNILDIKSAQGRRKAFGTCSSHLFSIGILFGTLLYMYMRPNSSYLRYQDKVVSVFYTVVIPMLNPIIYSMRNKDVLLAFLKVGKLTCRKNYS